MGCCFRPRKIKARIDTSGGKTPKIHGGRGNNTSESDRGPPPIEEEIISVKEVLSETPIPKPPDSTSPSSSTAPEVEDRRMEQKSVVEDGEESAVETRSEVFSQVSVSQVSVSQVSEINSASEGFETAAFRGEEEEVASRGGRRGGRVRREAGVGRGRACSGEMARGKESRVRSPAARRAVPETENRSRVVVPSPEKRNRATVPSPEKRSRKVNAAAAARRRSASPAGCRKDLRGRTVEFRRSRSPATRAGAGATRADGGVSRDVSEGKEEAVAASAAAEAAEAKESGSGGEVAKDGGEGGDFTETKESLENPNVSLECFIFL